MACCCLQQIINRKCSKWTTFDQLLLGKIITDAIRCLDFNSKFTKMCLAAELCPDPLWELTAIPTPLSWIQGVLILRGRQGECAQFCIQIWGRSPWTFLS